MADTYLSRTFGTPTNNYKWTLSIWVKRSKLGADQYMFQTYPNGYARVYFDNSDKIQFDGENTSSANPFDLKTNRLFRDTSGWYNIVVKWDVTQAVAADRVKLYINGVQETSFGTETYPAQNNTYPLNSASAPTFIGRHSTDVTTYFSGLMSHYYFIDGTAYDASTFGSIDATTGEWNINTAPTVTMGTNGFLIMENGNTITDQSANSNDWTLAGGTLTNTEDNPSDPFCTLNPLNTPTTGSSPVFSYGNNMVLTGTSSADFGGSGTLGLKKGIWYYEGLVVTSGDDNLRSVFGINSDPAITAKSNQEGQWNRWSYCWKGYLGQWWTNANATPGNGTNNDGYLNTYTNGDYIGVYFDLDNSKMLFTKNGVLERSGVSMAITPVADTDSGFYFPIYTDGHSGWSSSAKLNFGNGSFGNTALTGSEDVDWFRDAGGKGKFKYNPTQTIDSITWNARAICAKNINTYG